MRYLDFVSISVRKFLLPVRGVGDIGPHMSLLIAVAVSYVCTLRWCG